jgi:hypothetical protein
MADLNLQDLRDLHPRRMVQKYLFEDDPDDPPAPGTTGAGSVASAMTEPVAPVRRGGGPPLVFGDPAPFDLDCT